MNGKQRNRAFVKERNAQVRKAVLIQRNTAKEITALLLEARKRVDAELTILPTNFQQFQLPQVMAEIQAALRDFAQRSGNLVNLGAQDSWGTGIAVIDKPLAAGGVIVSSALPLIDSAQLTAMKQFMTSRINDISVEVINRINSEMGLILIGVQTPGEAAGKISRLVEGGRGRAVTIIRTELGRVFSIASQERMAQASEFLPGLKKRWRRSGKLHSRIAHDIADGQVRDQNKPFDVGGEKLMFPRDPRGSARNTINCGCISLPFMEHWKVKNPGRLHFTDEELRLSSQKQDLQRTLAAQTRKTAI